MPYFQAKVSKSNQARPKSKPPALENLSWSQEDTTSRSCYREGVPCSYSLGTSFASSRRTNMSSIQLPVPVNNIIYTYNLIYTCIIHILESARSITAQPDLYFEKKHPLLRTPTRTTAALRPEKPIVLVDGQKMPSRDENYVARQQLNVLQRISIRSLRRI